MHSKLGKYTTKYNEGIILGKYNLTISVIKCNYVGNDKSLERWLW